VNLVQTAYDNSVADGPAHKRLTILPLDPGNSGLLKSLADYMGACGAVCLNHAQHQPGVQMDVEGDHSGSFLLYWETLTEQYFRTCADLQEATEYGAYGIAILMIRELTGKTVLQRSAKGPGFDFWVGDEETDELPFQGLTRLEVSGILNGSAADVRVRVSVKKKQVRPSDALGPAFIVVVEFSRPVIMLEAK
jgi:hypothetical protein